MQKELNNKDEDDLVKLFDYTLTVIDNKLLRIIENDFYFLSRYYIYNISNLLNPKYKIDICNHMSQNIMNECQAKDAYKFIISNNRGYNMLYDLIKKEYNIIPHEFIINNLIHYYINDILDY